jgi:hypothetical protein
VVADEALVMRDGPETGCKFLSFFGRRPDLTADQFLWHWRERHGPLFLSLAAFRESVTRYVQYRCVPAQQRFFDGRAPVQPFDGVTELHFRSFPQIRAGFEEPEAAHLLGADVQRFLASPTLRLMLEPKELFAPDRSGTTAGEP